MGRVRPRRTRSHRDRQRSRCRAQRPRTTCAFVQRGSRPAWNAMRSRSTWSDASRLSDLAVVRAASDGLAAARGSAMSARLGSANSPWRSAIRSGSRGTVTAGVVSALGRTSRARDGQAGASSRTSSRPTRGTIRGIAAGRSWTVEARWWASPPPRRRGHRLRRPRAPPPPGLILRGPRARWPRPAEPTSASWAGLAAAATGGWQRLARIDGPRGVVQRLDGSPRPRPESEPATCWSRSRMRADHESRRSPALARRRSRRAARRGDDRARRRAPLRPARARRAHRRWGRAIPNVCDRCVCDSIAEGLGLMTD